MVDMVFSSAKQRNATSSNFYSRVNTPNEEGARARRFMRRVTGNKKYSERNWQRQYDNGKVVSKKEFKKDWIETSQKATKKLKEEWRRTQKKQKARRKKLPRNKRSQVKLVTWKKFRNANRMRDKDIGSLVTSP